MTLKKAFINIGIFSVVTTPIVAVISCNNNDNNKDPVKKEIENINQKQFEELGGLAGDAAKKDDYALIKRFVYSLLDKKGDIYKVFEKISRVISLLLPDLNLNILELINKINKDDLQVVLEAVHSKGLNGMNQKDLNSIANIISSFTGDLVKVKEYVKYAKQMVVSTSFKSFLEDNDGISGLLRIIANNSLPNSLMAIIKKFESGFLATTSQKSYYDGIISTIIASLKPLIKNNAPFLNKALGFVAQPDSNSFIKILESQVLLKMQNFLRNKISLLDETVKKLDFVDTHKFPDNFVDTIVFTVKDPDESSEDSKTNVVTTQLIASSFEVKAGTLNKKSAITLPSEVEVKFVKSLDVPLNDNSYNTNLVNDLSSGDKVYVKFFVKGDNVSTHKFPDNFVDTIVFTVKDSSESSEESKKNEESKIDVVTAKLIASSFEVTTGVISLSRNVSLPAEVEVRYATQGSSKNLIYSKTKTGLSIAGKKVYIKFFIKKGYPLKMKSYLEKLVEKLKNIENVFDERQVPLLKGKGFFNSNEEEFTKNIIFTQSLLQKFLLFFGVSNDENGTWISNIDSTINKMIQTVNNSSLTKEDAVILKISNGIKKLVKQEEIWRFATMDIEDLSITLWKMIHKKFNSKNIINTDLNNLFKLVLEIMGKTKYPVLSKDEARVLIDMFENGLNKDISKNKKHAKAAVAKLLQSISPIGLGMLPNIIFGK